MDDLKHLREVLTAARPLEHLRLSALARVVAALDGLPSAAIACGWTYKSLAAWVHKLEDERDVLRAEIAKLQHAEAERSQ